MIVAFTFSGARLAKPGCGWGPLTPQVFAIDCNNLAISTKEQFRGTEPGCGGEHRTPWCSSSLPLTS